VRHGSRAHAPPTNANLGLKTPRRGVNGFGYPPRECHIIARAGTVGSGVECARNMGGGARTSGLVQLLQPQVGPSFHLAGAVRVGGFSCAQATESLPAI
jgi:hypothetical protein